MVRRYRILADYHQFYLWDHGASPDAPTDFTAADVARRIKAAPFVVVVQPERNMEVPVEVEVVRDAPPLDLDRWDHVAEASLALPSGRLEIHECTGGSVDVVPVAPGIYRVRAEHGGLGTISPDGLDGQDRYRIVLWPAPFAEVSVLKQYGA
ncbi:hypothetical protein SAMN02799631_02888 [Methylobacterium sp. 174MFSha1.1]|uniref:hypothetical protein n=1 Tax=Methylobacterium sp. 174MFSha1.1 TaxID=1502749 RepID=UPI0008E4FA13|nr:hypothetical protein [Methylobacterium sp. 174MFSha1.1]SFU88345.1 hypothetical protein SAMN02799631_02888 [Methylobacterium sp. 174MFSha1.1]